MQTSNLGATGSQRAPEPPRDSRFPFKGHNLCQTQCQWDRLGTGLLVLGSEHVSSENRGLGSTYWKPWVGVQPGVWREGETSVLGNPAAQRVSINSQKDGC